MADGIAAWAVLKRAAGQVRAVMGGVYAIDFAAVLLLADAMVKAGCAFTRSLAHSGIAAWEGIGDADGNPVEPTKETIDAALELWSLFDAIDRLYVGPALLQDAEKNV